MPGWIHVEGLEASQGRTGIGKCYPDMQEAIEVDQRGAVARSNEWVDSVQETACCNLLVAVGPKLYRVSSPRSLLDE